MQHQFDLFQSLDNYCSIWQRMRDLGSSLSTRFDVHVKVSTYVMVVVVGVILVYSVIFL